MSETPKFVTTAAFAAAVGVSPTTIWRTCVDYPGFGIQLRRGGYFHIPAEYIERVLRGESPADIAAKVRAGGGQRAA